MRRILRLTVGVAGLCAFAGTARAHEVGGNRFDAPIPLELLFLGAAATVGATALVFAATGWRAGEGESQPLGAVSPAVATALSNVARGAFLLGFLAALYTGLLGPQVRAENFATVFVWPVWIRGLALVAILVGSPWRVLSPWRTAYELLARLEGEEVAVLGEYPSRLSDWPAVCFFVAGIGLLENLTVVPRLPRFTATVVALYAVVMLAGAVCFGRGWFRRADALEVFYRLLGRVAPIHATRRADGGLEIELRPPWRGATRPVATYATAVFVVATVYTLSFDGFTGTPEYQTLLFDLGNRLDLGSSAAVLLYAVGFLAFLVAFGAAVAATRSLVGDPDHTRLETTTSLAPTVLPISATYEFAHNYPYVLRNAGQLTSILGSYAGSASAAIDPLWWLSLPAFWWSQVALIVAGHLVAVAAAHGVVLRRYEGLAAARRAHVPVTALMVGYTVLSLWIVSRPVVS